MPDILKEIKVYAAGLESRIEQLQVVPQSRGCLSVIRKNGRAFYLYRIADNGAKNAEYISLCNEPLLRELAHSKYVKKILPKLEANLKAANAFIYAHSGTEEDMLAGSFDPAVLKFCEDLYVPETTAVQNWLNSKGPEAPLYGGAPEIMTAGGIAVRSKSEAIIANMLYANDQVFLYEKALYLPSKNYAFFPDFTILRKKDLKEIYWEHFGMMDDPEYLNAALEKIAAYIQNGVIPGRDLICTFETRRKPLSSMEVEQYINAILL